MLGRPLSIELNVVCLLYEDDVAEKTNRQLKCIIYYLLFFLNVCTVILISTILSYFHDHKVNIVLSSISNNIIKILFFSINYDFWHFAGMGLYVLLRNQQIRRCFLYIVHYFITDVTLCIILSLMSVSYSDRASEQRRST